ARVLPRGGVAGGASLSTGGAGGPVHRPAERAREAHHRPPLHLRRRAHAVACRGLGEFPARLARSARGAVRRRPRPRPGAHADAASMCRSVPTERVARTPAQRLWRAVSMVRYRFFLYAGLLPYLLGAAWAWAIAGTFDAPLFWGGLFRLWA